MAGCLKYKCLLCIHPSFFFPCKVCFLFSFCDILAAGWVKLLRTLQKSWGRLVLYVERHGQAARTSGDSLQHALKKGEKIYIYYYFLLCLNCHECARGRVPCPTGTEVIPCAPC